MRLAQPPLPGLPPYLGPEGSLLRVPSLRQASHSLLVVSTNGWWVMANGRAGRLMASEM